MIMQKGIIIGLVLVLAVAIIGGGIWLASRSQTAPSTAMPVPETTNTNQEETIVTPTETTLPVDRTTTTTAAGKIVEVVINASNFKFAPTKIEVNKGDTVKLTLKSAGSSHDFVIDELEVATSELGDGEEEEIEFVAEKVGTFEFYCSVGNHRKMGMVGSLVVK